MRERLSRLAAEEIAAGVLLAGALIAVALQPSAIGRMFESPYATPAPESGATTFLRDRIDRPVPSADVATRPRTLPQAPVFLQAPVVSSPGRTIVIYDRSGRSVFDVSDHCWEAATTAARTGQPVVCAPRPATRPPVR